MARWQFCNVLQFDATARLLWQFDAAKDGFKLNRTHVLDPGKPVPAGAVAKSWDSLWRKKLNVALLPADKVFLRVLQLPVADEAEARQIVELQLERLSPLPVTQIVWTLHLLPKGENASRPIVALIADRGFVEKYLGKLEAEGFLADRLESSALDQILATAPNTDGAWIYPGEAGAASLVAWWAEGQLRNLAWLNLPDGEGREAALREQLSQMTWAGEMEGWVAGTPRFHLVADVATAVEWRPLFDRMVETTVEVSEPLSPTELMARTARRAAAAATSLMPPDFLKRYQQQFVDRLWMRGVGTLIGVYIFSVLAYFAALQFAQMKLAAAESSLRQTSLDYTNAVQTRQKYEVMRDRADLKFAALDCWKAVSGELPDGFVVLGLDFTAGKTLTVTGTAPSDAGPKLTDFNARMMKTEANGKPLFARDKGSSPTYSINPGGNQMTWTLRLELDRPEKN